MNVRVLDTNFEPLWAVDLYESLIWTDRFDEYGDFEIYTQPSSTIASMLKKDYYLEMDDSDKLMIIETFKTQVDEDAGKHLIVSGRSLESILERRIVWNQTILNGNFQNAMKKLFEDNIINPSIAGRKIGNFIFKESSDPIITELTIDAQYTGDDIYTIVKNNCLELGIGFQIVLNENKQFEFSFLSGRDLSYDQNIYPVVAFSPGFENLKNSTYTEDNSTLKTVALVAGEGEGVDRRTTAVETSGETGLLRRELFVDARDISSTTEQQTKLTNDQYLSLLSERGKKKLAENFSKRSFDGEADVNGAFELNKDFFLGDIVEIIDEYGKNAKSRVIEIIHSDDQQKRTTIPTFSSAELNLEFDESENTQTSSGITPISDRISQIRSDIDKMNDDVTSVIEKLSVVVTGIDTLYTLTSSEAGPDGNSKWVTTIDYIPGSWLWTKTKTLYADGHTVESHPMCILTGDMLSSINVKEVREMYYLSTSNESLSGGTWVSTPPKYLAQHYYWTKTVFTYTDSDNITESTPVLANGLNDANTAAMTANANAAELIERANSGEFNGKDGEVGPQAHVVISVVSSNYAAKTIRLEANLYVNGELISENVTYKWLKNNVSIGGATNKILDISNVDYDSSYQCICGW